MYFKIKADYWRDERLTTGQFLGLLGSILEEASYDANSLANLIKGGDNTIQDTSCVKNLPNILHSGRMLERQLTANITFKGNNWNKEASALEFRDFQSSTLVVGMA